jgi:hypothetical protein
MVPLTELSASRTATMLKWLVPRRDLHREQGNTESAFEKINDTRFIYLKKE